MPQIAANAKQAKLPKPSRPDAPEKPREPSEANDPKPGAPTQLATGQRNRCDTKRAAEDQLPGGRERAQRVGEDLAEVKCTPEVNDRSLYRPNRLLLVAA